MTMLFTQIYPSHSLPLSSPVYFHLLFKDLFLHLHMKPLLKKGSLE